MAVTVPVVNIPFADTLKVLASVTASATSRVVPITAVVATLSEAFRYAWLVTESVDSRCAVPATLNVLFNVAPSLTLRVSDIMMLGVVITAVVVSPKGAAPVPIVIALPTLRVSVILMLVPVMPAVEVSPEGAAVVPIVTAPAENVVDPTDNVEVILAPAES